MFFYLPKAICLNNKTGSKLSFEKSGLIRLNNKTFGEYNIKDLKTIWKIVSGSYRVLNNEIRFEKYRLVFEQNSWKFMKYTKCKNQVISCDSNICGSCHFSKFNEIERKQFFNHSLIVD